MLATAVADLQYTLKGIQGEDQDEVLCALGKLAELAIRQLNLFRRESHGPSFLDLPTSGGAGREPGRGGDGGRSQLCSGDPHFGWEGTGIKKFFRMKYNDCV